MRVNDIFYSLQGEGYHTGRAAVFVRFAGCNLRCSFCDTEFDSYREMTADEIVTTISQYPARFVVLTGGEPTLQVDEAFVDLLHQHSFEVAMESNGTRPAPQNLDWPTVSPKRLRGKAKEDTGKRLPDELKVIFDEDTDPETYLSTLHAPLLFLQPCDTGNAERNAVIINKCVDYIKEHPEWRLSLQTHKLVGFK
jgi:organic radical activating enzyme